MTIDEAIKHCLDVAEEKAENDCRECAADHRQLAAWLTELKQWRRVYGVCPSYEMCIPECKEGYNAQIAHYDDERKKIREYLQHSAKTMTVHGVLEALALIGEDTNVPASADDTNVDHKSGSWISCEDRLPETPEEGLGVWYSDCCLVCDSHDWCGMAYYLTDNKKSWWEFADAQNKVKIDWTEVTHWMPLPDPPKDGERNDT